MVMVTLSGRGDRCSRSTEELAHCNRMPGLRVSPEVGSDERSDFGGPPSGPNRARGRCESTSRTTPRPEQPRSCQVALHRHRLPDLARCREPSKSTRGPLSRRPPAAARPATSWAGPSLLRDASRPTLNHLFHELHRDSGPTSHSSQPASWPPPTNQLRLMEAIPPMHAQCAPLGKRASQLGFLQASWGRRLASPSLVLDARAVGAAHVGRGDRGRLLHPSGRSGS